MYEKITKNFKLIETNNCTLFATVRSELSTILFKGVACYSKKIKEILGDDVINEIDCALKNENSLTKASIISITMKNIKGSIVAQEIINSDISCYEEFHDQELESTELYKKGNYLLIFEDHDEINNEYIKIT